MTFPVVYDAATDHTSGPTPGAQALMAWALATYPPGSNLGCYDQGKQGEPGAALTAPAQANTHGRGASVSDRTCSVDDCVKPVYAKSLCNKHWQRWRKHGDPAVCLTDLAPLDGR